MQAPAWLAQLLQVDGEIEEEELAARLAQRLRLQAPTGPEGIGVMKRFALLAETLHRKPERLVQESLPDAPEDAGAAAAQLGLRTRSDLERVLRLAARELWAWMTPQTAAPAPEPKAKRPSSPRNRAAGVTPLARAAAESQAAEERLAAFAAQAIAEVRGEPPAGGTAPAAQGPGTPPPPAAPAVPADPDARLETFAAAAMAEARSAAERQAAAEAAAVPAAAAPVEAREPAPPAAAVATPGAPTAVPAAEPPAAASTPALPRTFAEQLEAAGPLLVFLATVGAASILAMLVWLIGTAVGAFANSGI